MASCDYNYVNGSANPLAANDLEIEIMQHQAINPTHQRAIERLYKADRTYCAQVDRHQEKLDSLDPDSDRWHDTAERIEQRQAEQFDNLVERFIDEPELPKRELEAFSKSYVAFHGYTPYLV